MKIRVHIDLEPSGKRCHLNIFFQNIHLRKKANLVIRLNNICVFNTNQLKVANIIKTKLTNILIHITGYICKKLRKHRNDIIFFNHL